MGRHRVHGGQGRLCRQQPQQPQKEEGAAAGDRRGGHHVSAAGGGRAAGRRGCRRWRRRPAEGHRGQGEDAKQPKTVLKGEELTWIIYSETSCFPNVI